MADSTSAAVVSLILSSLPSTVGGRWNQTENGVGDDQVVAMPIARAPGARRH